MGHKISRLLACLPGWTFVGVAQSKTEMHFDEINVQAGKAGGGL